MLSQLMLGGEEGLGRRQGSCASLCICGREGKEELLSLSVFLPVSPSVIIFLLVVIHLCLRVCFVCHALPILMCFSNPQSPTIPFPHLSCSCETMKVCTHSCSCTASLSLTPCLSSCTGCGARHFLVNYHWFGNVFSCLSVRAHSLTNTLIPCPI